MSMTRQEVLRALAEDESKVEYMFGDGEWGPPSFGCLYPDMFFADHWRIKPVPTGDLTHEEAKEAINRGDMLEAFIGGEWEDSLANYNGASGISVGVAYRIKPKSELVPLGMEDIKPGDAIRHETWDLYEWRLVEGVQKGRVYYTTGNSVFMADLQRYYHITRDNGKTWQRCEKEGR